MESKHIIGVDIAKGDSRDYSVVSVVEVMPDGHLKVVEMTHLQALIHERRRQINELVELCAVKYNVPNDIDHIFRS